MEQTNQSWKYSLHQQREELARMLREPLEKVAGQLAPAWGECAAMDAVLAAHFAGIPHCSLLYCVGMDGIQISNSVSPKGVAYGQVGHDRSQRPYMREAVPIWGYLLSDAYLGLDEHHLSLTALRVIYRNELPLGYLGARFDLRNLPVMAELYEEPDNWRQIKGDPAIRELVFQQSRVESPMDRTLDRSLSILEELLTECGIFQCQVEFSKSLATIWTLDDPYRYRILDHEALSDPGICLLYPPRVYPAEAVIAANDIGRILTTLRTLRLTDPTIYLRVATINTFNGMVSATFSCDGSHYMPHDEFLVKDTAFWFGAEAKRASQEEIEGDFPRNPA